LYYYQPLKSKYSLQYFVLKKNNLYFSLRVRHQVSESWKTEGQLKLLHVSIFHKYEKKTKYSDLNCSNYLPNLSCLPSSYMETRRHSLLLKLWYFWGSTTHFCSHITVLFCVTVTHQHALRFLCVTPTPIALPSPKTSPWVFPYVGDIITSIWPHAGLLVGFILLIVVQ
jgi:hypothetical protein